MGVALCCMLPKDVADAAVGGNPLYFDGAAQIVA
jgi:hypothetical protein